ncbi:hypothetical protein ACWKWU_04165 [Chitinophaga lutea]
MSMQEIIHLHGGTIAFIAGNGINRYPDNPPAISWEHLLLNLWKRFVPHSELGKSIPSGITHTEFYDLLDLASPSGEGNKANAIQKAVAAMMRDWRPRDHHRQFIQTAMRLDAPVLTTNFDLLLPQSMQLEPYHMETKGFTDFYPWSTYYAHKALHSPTDGFGVWYVNGCIGYHRSIRLGLTHYMGCVDRTRDMLHKGDDNPFTSKDLTQWKGAETWLHIVLNRDLCIFGLSLEENEVFIRWLLIERARYFKKFPERRRKGWYVAPASEAGQERYAGKKMFLTAIGLECITVADYDAIYRAPWE